MTEEQWSGSTDTDRKLLVNSSIISLDAKDNTSSYVSSTEIQNNSDLFVESKIQLKKQSSTDEEANFGLLGKNSFTDTF